jgi:uncharacterized protein (TIGR02284 family)
MAQDREYAPSSSREPQTEERGRSVAPADRPAETADEAWKTAKAVGSRALDTGRSFGRQIARDPFSPESIAVFAIGAAAGLALAYSFFRSSSSSSVVDRRADEMVSILNGLIKISRDGERGFEACADGVADEELKRVFREGAERCRAGAEELEREVQLLGGDAARRGTASGAIHRAWVNVKSSVSGMDELAILDECERGEDVAKAAYQAALTRPLSALVRVIVERQHRGVVQIHDRVRALRDRKKQASQG